MTRAIIALALGLAAGCPSRPAPASPPVAPATSPTDEATPIPGDSPPVDTDGDGLADPDDACPTQAMAMSSNCPPERQRGCPDDCRPPTIVEP